MKAFSRAIQLLRIMFQHSLHHLPIFSGSQRFFLNILSVVVAPVSRNRVSGTDPQRLQKALIEMGPLFIKFGQLLATRADLLSEDFYIALSKLQDNVPPFSSELAIRTIESRFKKPLADIFLSFDPKPLAAASMAQVHTAVLNSHERVAVKILRPTIGEEVARDCHFLKMIALFLSLFSRFEAFKPIEVVEQIAHTLGNELDLLKEAANASMLRHHFEGSALLKVPKVYWDYCHTDILVTEKIEGTPIHQIERLKSQQVDLKRLAEGGVEIFFTQVFRDRFFHADMHAGNLFVIGSANYPQYAAVDFGIMGALSANDQTYLALNFLAFFQRDYAKIAEYHIASGWVSKATNEIDLEADFRTLLEPIFSRPLEDISFGLLLLGLLQVGKKHAMIVQPQLLLLQKTLFSIEGLGKQLYPQLNLWTTAKPFLEQWAKKRFGFKATIKQLKREWPLLQEQLPNLIERWINPIRTTEASPKTSSPPYKDLFLIALLGITSGVGVLNLIYFAR